MCGTSRRRRDLAGISVLLDGDQAVCPRHHAGSLPAWLCGRGSGPALHGPLFYALDTLFTCIWLLLLLLVTPPPPPSSHPFAPMVVQVVYPPSDASISLADFDPREVQRVCRECDHVLAPMQADLQVGACCKSITFAEFTFAHHFLFFVCV